MQCLRCGGLLIAIHMRDMGQPPISGWRCMLCGAITDPGIESNKVKPSLPTQNSARLPGSSPARSKKPRA